MALQSMLVKEGFNVGPVDGRFGCRSRKAMRAFLSSKGYATGCCRTGTALQAVLAKQPTSKEAPVAKATEVVVKADSVVDAKQSSAKDVVVVCDMVRPLSTPLLGAA